MISTSELEVLADKLYVYDVEQGAWEQEPNGIESNVAHTLTHLTKDLIRKDFTDVELVRDAIAPDSIQYALRLSRWADVRVSDINTLTAVEEAERSLVEAGLPNKLPMGFANFAGATAVLAEYTHNLGHNSTQEQTRLATRQVMKSAARQLVFSAAVQAYQYDFSLPDAFDARLGVLRERFGIPEPTA